MTIEKTQRDFGQEITKNGLTEATRTTDTNNIVYHRVWNNDGKRWRCESCSAAPTLWLQ